VTPCLDVTVSCRSADADELPQWARVFDRWPLDPSSASALAPFSRAAVEADAERLRRDPAAPGARVFVDATPEYLSSAVAPARVQRLAPDARFLVVLRVWPRQPSYCICSSCI
jgi:hypothetical protein